MYSPQLFYPCPKVRFCEILQMLHTTMISAMRSLQKCSKIFLTPADPLTTTCKSFFPWKKIRMRYAAGALEKMAFREARTVIFLKNGRPLAYDTRVPYALHVQYVRARLGKPGPTHAHAYRCTYMAANAAASMRTSAWRERASLVSRCRLLRCAITALKTASPLSPLRKLVSDLGPRAVGRRGAGPAPSSLL